MKTALKIALYFICFNNINQLAAQTDEMIFYPVNNPVLRHYDIRKIIATKDGKLWLSLNKGIISFDGNEVRLFDIDDFFRSASHESDKLYLVGNLGLSEFNLRTGKTSSLEINLTTENSSPIPGVYTEILIDSDKTIWAGRFNGFIHYDPATKANAFYPLLAPSGTGYIGVRCLINDPNDATRLWIGTDDGIYWYDKKKKTLQRNFRCSYLPDSSAFDNKILKMHAGKTDTIWFTVAGRGVGCYNTKSGRYTIYPFNRRTNPDNSANSNFDFLFPKNADEYYIGFSDKNPGVFNTRTCLYNFSMRLAKENSRLNIRDFFADSTGNLWCVESGQLYYANAEKNKFNTLRLEESYPIDRKPSSFRKIIWDFKTKHYYAAFTNSNKIIVLDGSFKLIKSIPVEKPYDQTNSPWKAELCDIAMDKMGKLWFCGNSLMVYDSLKGKMVPVQSLFSKLIFRDQRFQNMVARGDYLFIQPSNPAYKAIYRINILSTSYDSIPIPYEIVPLTDSNSWNRKFHQERLVIDKQGRYAYVGIDESILQVDLATQKWRKVIMVNRENYSFFMSWYILDDEDRLWVTSKEGIRIIEPLNFRTVKKIYHENSGDRFQMYNADGLGLVCLLYSGGIILYDYKKDRNYRLSQSDGLLTNFNRDIASANGRLFVGPDLGGIQHISVNTANTFFHPVRRCYLSGIRLFDQPYVTDTLPEFLHAIRLPHNKNFVTLTFSCSEFQQPEHMEYRYKLAGVDDYWVYTNYLNRTISYANLKPGNYIFYTAVKNRDNSWSEGKQNLNIIIIPAWWQMKWFKISVFIITAGLFFWLIRWRIKVVRKQEKQRSAYEKELLELEAKALRAQMNPHFIFNCLNSIKSLIQDGEKDKSVTYLTTFSKLIRTLFNNADKKEISLYDEIETSKLYLQLEAMRFDSKFSYNINIDETIDLKSISVPALIIQPFIENAIWHGIVPKGSGGNVSLNVSRSNGNIEIVVDDNGIGRESSQQNKGAGSIGHQSKGVNLTQSRLELDNLLQQRKAKLETTDKRDEHGKASGTKVVIILPQEE